MPDFFDVLKKRRSIRSFAEKEVPLDLVMEIIKESCFAPNAENGQPWQFIVINNREWIERLSEESKKNILAYLAKNPDSPVQKYKAVLSDKNYNVFYKAPSLVYFVGERNKQTLQIDCALAACYFMLLASARGLGTCWVGLGMNIKDPEIREQMGLPGDYRIVAPIALGYPKKIPKPPKRKEPRILKIFS
ncbi:nitroreductase family protein [Thermodesulfobacteriota bacterium]